jgi:phospholipase C
MPDGFLQRSATMQNGTLPEVSWIIAPSRTASIPAVEPGAGRLVRAAGARRADRQPGVWSKTVLLINYDENDGFFDHLPPPAPSRNADGTLAGGSTLSDSRHGRRVSHLHAGHVQPARDRRPPYGPARACRCS